MLRRKTTIGLAATHIMRMSWKARKEQEHDQGKIRIGIALREAGAELVTREGHQGPGGARGEHRAEQVRIKEDVET